MCIVLDTVTFDFHMDLAPDATGNGVKALLAVMDTLGLEPLDEDESPSILLDNDWTRVYFTPKTGLADYPLVSK